MSAETLILLILAVAVIVSLPTWPYSRSWGYGPSGIGLVVCILLLIWVFSNHRPGSTGDRIQSDMQQIGRDLNDSTQRQADKLRDSVHDATR